MENITDVDYRHAKEYLKFLIPKAQVSSMTCMLKVKHYYFQLFFENVIDKYIEINEFDPAQFLSVPGLPWQALKRKEKRLELLANIDMLLILGK